MPRWPNRQLFQRLQMHSMHQAMDELNAAAEQTKQEALEAMTELRQEYDNLLAKSRHQNDDSHVVMQKLVASEQHKNELIAQLQVGHVPSRIGIMHMAHLQNMYICYITYMHMHMSCTNVLIIMRS